MNILQALFGTKENENPLAELMARTARTLNLADPRSMEEIISAGVNLPWQAVKALRVATSVAAVLRLKELLVPLKKQLVEAEVVFVTESTIWARRIEEARTAKFQAWGLRGKARETAKAEWQTAQGKIAASHQNRLQAIENQRTVSRAEEMLRYNKLVLEINQFVSRANSAQQELGIKNPADIKEESLITEVEVASLAEDVIHAREEADALEAEARKLQEQSVEAQRKLNEVQNDLQASREVLTIRVQEIRQKVAKLQAEALAKREGAAAVA